jgi:hypothetical protein
MNYQVVSENINISNMDDLRSAVMKTKELSAGKDDHLLQIHYTGAFFTKADELLSVEYLQDTVIEYFLSNYEPVNLDDTGIGVTNKTSLKHRTNKLYIDSCSIVKVYNSERESIIADIVKNSATS